jgi:hypothetical protein
VAERLLVAQQHRLAARLRQDEIEVAVAVEVDRRDGCRRIRRRRAAEYSTSRVTPFDEAVTQEEGFGGESPGDVAGETLGPSTWKEVSAQLPPAGSSQDATRQGGGRSARSYDPGAVRGFAPAVTMKSVPRSAWKSVSSSLGSLALVALCLWRAPNLARRLPNQLHWSGMREGLTWGLEPRLQQAFLRAPASGQTLGAEAWELFRLLRAHVPERAVVVADIAQGPPGREVVAALAALGFPRLVLQATTGPAQAELPVAAAGRELYALGPLERGSAAGTLVARTAYFELRRLAVEPR